MSKLKEDLQKNIGCRATVVESTIPFLNGQEVTITDVFGDEKKGFRYEVKIDESKRSKNHLDVYYPPVFLCEVK